MGKGVFITGIDTGIGKTTVSCAILRAMSAQGVRACGIKPIETGSAEGEDAMLLKRAAGVFEPMEAIAPYRFKEPAAPYVAARKEGASIDTAALVEHMRRVSGRYEVTLAEGAGGLMVPIKEGYMMIDLIDDMGWPVVLVTHPYLGCINHTLLSLDALGQRGLEVAGIIINRPRPGSGSLAEETAREMMESFGSVETLADLPYMEAGDQLEKYIDTERILRAL